MAEKKRINITDFPIVRRFNVPGPAGTPIFVNVRQNPDVTLEQHRLSTAQYGLTHFGSPHMVIDLMYFVSIDTVIHELVHVVQCTLGIMTDSEEPVVSIESMAEIFGVWGPYILQTAGVIQNHLNKLNEADDEINIINLIRGEVLVIHGPSMV
jgi:hypothetical protein